VSRIHIIDGELAIEFSLIYETAVLTQGPEGAGERIRDVAAKLIHDEELRNAIYEASQRPVFVPLTQTDKSNCVYGFCRELGECVGKVRGTETLDLLCDAFGYGFATILEIETPEGEGLARLCFRGGEMAGTLVAALFSESDNPDFQPPEFNKIMRSFHDGVVGAKRESRKR
jgi:hypothetical protein